MIAQPAEEVKARAQRLQARLGRGEIKEGSSTVGGGSLPEETLPTFVLSLKVARADEFSKKLRQSEMPVIARIEQDQIVIDLRTVLPGQDELLAGVLQKAFA